LGKAGLGNSGWEEMHISGEEDRAFPLRIAQWCLDEALGEAESRLRLARLADGQLKETKTINAW